MRALKSGENLYILAYAKELEQKNCTFIFPVGNTTDSELTLPMNNNEIIVITIIIIV